MYMLGFAGRPLLDRRSSNTKSAAPIIVETAAITALAMQDFTGLNAQV
jgi:hypothetical protein